MGRLLTVWLSVSQHLGLASAWQAWLIGRSWSKLAVIMSVIAVMLEWKRSEWLTRANWGAGCRIVAVAARQLLVDTALLSSLADSGGGWVHQWLSRWGGHDGGEEGSGDGEELHFD